MAKYEVQKSKHDASRPYIVVANIRSFNKVIGRYQLIEQAKRKARDLNRWNR